MSTRLSIVLAVSVLAFGFGSATAQAAFVTFNFTGTVNDFEATNFTFQSLIYPGDSFYGSYTFEAPQTPEDGDYVLSDLTMTIGLNTFSFYSDIAEQILVTNSDPDEGTDYYQVLGGMTFDSKSLLFDMMMVDPSGSALTDNSLPVEPPDLSFFNSTILMIDYVGSGEGVRFDLDGTIDSLTVIPSPTSTLLGLIGLAAVFSLRRQFG